MLGPKTAYFLGSRSGAGFSFSLWSLKGCNGLEWGPTNGPFYFHPYILRFLTERRPKTLQFTRFRAPLVQDVAIHKLWGAPGPKTFQFTRFPGFLGSPCALWALPPTSWGFPWPSWWLLGSCGAFWCFLGSPRGSWGFLGPPEAFWGSPGAFWGLLGLPVRRRRNEARS